MYENHRKSFYRDAPRDFDDDRYDERWRADQGGWQNRGGRFAGERDERQYRNRAGYGSTYRDDEHDRYSGYGPDGAPEYWRASHDRDQYRSFSHDPDHHRYGQGASSYGYGAGQPYGRGEGDSRYFTGQQGSWAVGSSYGSRGAQRFGADYRDHGYTSRHDDSDRGLWDRATDEVASWFGDEDAARRREADHRGRGPKDYIRSDERIREDANDRLTDDPRVDASNVTLEVKTGEVTLNGTVGSRAEKRRAEDIVEQISGAKHVQNNLRVAEQSVSGGQPSYSLNTQPGTAEGGTLAQPRGTASRQPAKV